MRCRILQEWSGVTRQNSELPEQSRITGGCCQTATDHTSQSKLFGEDKNAKTCTQKREDFKKIICGFKKRKETNVQPKEKFAVPCCLCQLSPRDQAGWPSWPRASSTTPGPSPSATSLRSTRTRATCGGPPPPAPLPPPPAPSPAPLLPAPPAPAPPAPPAPLPPRWLTADYLCDFLYFLDIIVFKHRLIFMERGFWVKDKRKLIRNYIQRGSFRWYGMVWYGTGPLKKR